MKMYAYVKNAQNSMRRKEEGIMEKAKKHLSEHGIINGSI